MMRSHRGFFVVVAAIAGGTRANAQTCTGGAAARDACRKTIDLVNFLSPQYAAALAGGNPTMSQSGSLGGLGKFAVAVRSTRVLGDLPTISGQAFATTGETNTSYASRSTLIPALSVDMSFGLFRGFDAGAVHAGGVDALLSATYMSALSNGSLDVALEGSNTNFGFGLRVGVIEETSSLPGVALTYLHRDMPRFGITAATTSGNGLTTAPGTIAATSLLVTSSSLRLTAGKRFGVADLTGGVGRDRYSSAANVKAVVNAAAPIGSQTATGTAALDMTRMNLFASGALNLAAFKFVGELGMATGGNAPTALNSFGSAAGKARTYFTLAVRIGF